MHTRTDWIRKFPKEYYVKIKYIADGGADGLKALMGKTKAKWACTPFNSWPLKYTNIAICVHQQPCRFHSRDNLIATSGSILSNLLII